MVGCDDLIIVGGGMAGATAALWARRLGIAARLIERDERLGGQLYAIHSPLIDYPGFRGSGAELAAQLSEQLADSGVAISTGEEALSLTIPSDGKVLELETLRGHYRARALLWAAGLDRRRLVIADQFAADGGGGIYYSSGGRESPLRGSRLVIVGGGDGAIENLNRLLPDAPAITLLVRSEVSARPDLTRELASLCERYPDRLNLLSGWQPLRLIADATRQLRAVLLRDDSGAEQTIEAEAMLIKIGFQANRPHLIDRSGEVELRFDRRSGAILCGRDQASGVARLWAAGDVSEPLDPSLAVAAGQAAVAMRHIERSLRREQSDEKAIFNR